MGLWYCARVSPVHTALRNCTRDEGRPFEVGNQVLISSHRKLHRDCPDRQNLAGSRIIPVPIHNLMELAAHSRLPFAMSVEHGLMVRLHDLPAWQAARCCLSVPLPKCWAVSFYATCHPCTRPLGSILHAVAFHGPDIVQPSHHAKIDDLLDGLRARISAIIS